MGYRILRSLGCGDGGPVLKTLGGGGGGRGVDLGSCSGLLLCALRLGA